jgi:hypothetical protein
MSNLSDWSDNLKPNRVSVLRSCFNGGRDILVCLMSILMARRHAAPGTNQKKYPHIVELAVGKHGLDVGLGRRIMHFHNLRHIKPRHGHIVLKEHQTYYRWCFSDLTTVQAFIEQIGGTVYVADTRRRIAANIASCG